MSSFEKFVRANWTQLTALVILSFGLGAFRADAANTLKDHDDRLKSLEAMAPAITADLATIKGQQAVILTNLGQVQGRLMEREK